MRYLALARGAKEGKPVLHDDSEAALKQIAALRQVWRHIIAHMVLTREAILEEGGKLKKIFLTIFKTIPGFWSEA